MVHYFTNRILSSPVWDILPLSNPASSFRVRQDHQRFLSGSKLISADQRQPPGVTFEMTTGALNLDLNIMGCEGNLVLNPIHILKL
jgi:hypothetical protein